MAAKTPPKPKPLFLSSLLGDNSSLSFYSFLIIIFVLFPVFFFSAVTLLKFLSPLPPGKANGMCSGKCSLPKGSYNPSRNHNKFPQTCLPLDPPALFFLRIPKTTTTRFLTISERVRRNKGWVMTEFPDLPDAVAASKEVAKWDPRQQNLDPESRQRFYKGILAKVGLHASGSMVGLPWRKLVAPSAADPGASRFDIQGRVTRMFFYGHVFLPRWEDGRHFKTKEELLAKVPSVIAFVKDPVSRMQSAYNYVRVGARSEEHRKEILQNRGNLTVGECVADPSCVAVNHLRKSCSVQALYFCGVDEVCDVYWDAVNSENYEELLTPMVERAVLNMETRVLFTGVAEEMALSYEIFETILPTYFEGAGHESRVLRAGSTPFERDFKTGVGELGATNEAAPYVKANGGDRSAILKQGICWADEIVYGHATKLLGERAGLCGKEAATDSSEL